MDWNADEDISETHDNSLLKKVLTPALDSKAWEKPQDNGTAKVNFVARLKEGAVVVDKRENFEFVIGFAEDVTAHGGFDLAIKSLKAGKDLRKRKRIKERKCKHSKIPFFRGF